MGIRLHTILSVTLLAVSVGAVVGIPSHVTAANADAITASDVMYSSQEKSDFSIQIYLARRAPHLSRQAEAISHWAGANGISPKVLIALMEQESGSVSRKRRYPGTVPRPFGNLSPKTGFNAQLRDVAERLKAIVMSQREMALSGKAGFVPVDPIQALYAQSGRSKNAATFAGRVQFASTYAGMFNEIWGSAVKPDVLSKEITKAIPSSTLLRLPYGTNDTWATTTGPHSDSGSGTIMSSLDLAPVSTSPNKNVRASADGTLIRHSSCYVEIIHGNGWSTHYYHLDSIRFQNNTQVYQGDWIASPATTKTQALCNGGSWGGLHLHWTLTKNGIENSLNGVAVSGYVIKATSTINYDTNCSLNSLKKGSTRCFGTHLTNTL
jgi:LasA protease